MAKRLSKRKVRKMIRAITYNDLRELSPAGEHVQRLANPSVIEEFTVRITSSLPSQQWGRTKTHTVLLDLGAWVLSPGALEEIMTVSLDNLSSLDWTDIDTFVTMLNETTRLRSELGHGTHVTRYHNDVQAAALYRLGSLGNSPQGISQVIVVLNNYGDQKFKDLGRSQLPMLFDRLRWGSPAEHRNNLAQDRIFTITYQEMALAKSIEHLDQLDWSDLNTFSELLKLADDVNDENYEAAVVAKIIEKLDKLDWSDGSMHAGMLRLAHESENDELIAAIQAKSASSLHLIAWEETQNLVTMATIDPAHVDKSYQLQVAGRVVDSLWLKKWNLVSDHVAFQELIRSSNIHPDVGLALWKSSISKLDDLNWNDEPHVVLASLASGRGDAGYTNAVGYRIVALTKPEELATLREKSPVVDQVVNTWIEQSGLLDDGEFENAVQLVINRIDPPDNETRTIAEERIATYFADTKPNASATEISAVFAELDAMRIATIEARRAHAKPAQATV